MIKSMTGYAKSEAKQDGIVAIVEIKSLNGRYLDISCKMPKYLYHKEIEARDMIKKVLGRGSVSLMINVESETGSGSFGIDHDSVSEIYQNLNEMRKALKIRETVKIDHLLQFADIFQKSDDNDIAESQWKIVKRALRNAIRSLDNMRKREGKNIHSDTSNRINQIDQAVRKIEKLGIERIPEEREKMRHRIAQLFESDEIDEQRIQMEIVILADKLDISEECVRLKSHISYFGEILKSKETSGKKLNFILQEMHREINTIGSKTNDPKISRLVVEVKEELERIREQVQNIE